MGRRHPLLVGGGALLVTAAIVAGASALALGTRPVQNGGAGSRGRRQSSRSSGAEPLDPALFAAGSCVAYPPTSGNRHLTVFLDAGHGGLDPGGLGSTLSGATIYESDATLPVELDAMSLLRAQGFRVVVSRTTDSTVLRLGPEDQSGGLLTLLGAHDDVAARAVCANDAKASALVGIYYDTGESSQNAGSIAAYDDDRPFSSASLTLATLVQNDVLTLMNAQGWAIPNDGVQTDEDLGSVSGDPDSGGLAAEAESYDHLMLIGPAMLGYFSTPSQMPGMVIEPLYITDPFEGSLAASPGAQMVIAQGIATAVEQFLAPSPKVTKSVKRVEGHPHPRGTHVGGVRS
jgi:N-acetylmuramoyl-L-alanine amidase